jgi:hypothetical protein
MRMQLESDIYGMEPDAAITVVSIDYIRPQLAEDINSHKRQKTPEEFLARILFKGDITALHRVAYGEVIKGDQDG